MVRVFRALSRYSWVVRGFLKCGQANFITTMSPLNIVEEGDLIGCIGAAVNGLRWLLIRSRWVSFLIASPHSDGPTRYTGMWNRVLAVREEMEAKFV